MGSSFRWIEMFQKQTEQWASLMSFSAVQTISRLIAFTLGSMFFISNISFLEQLNDECMFSYVPLTNSFKSHKLIEMRTKMPEIVPSFSFNSFPQMYAKSDCHPK